MGYESTTSLAKRFIANPGDEDESFEVKSKRKLASRTGRIDVVKILSAISNTRGGTMLIGLRHDNDDVVIEDFPPYSEAGRDLLALSHGRTLPSLADFVNVRPVSYSGKRLLRIDVDRIPRGLIAFKEGSNKWTPYRRVGSGTQPMTAHEIYARGQEDTAREGIPDLLPGARFDNLKSQALTWTIPKGPPLRVITETEPHFHPVFGEVTELNTFDRPAVFHLSGRPNLRKESDWEPFLAAVSNHLDTRFDGLCYSIKVGRRVWCGVGMDALLADVGRIRKVGMSLLSGPPRPKPTHDARFLPLLSGFIPTHNGFFWFQAEYQGSGGFWFRGDCGLVMSDVLFDDEGPRAFFKEIGGLPLAYVAEARPLGLTLHGHIRLSRARHVAGSRDNPDFLFIEADNPFHGRYPDVVRQSDVPLPEEILRGFCSIPRVMFQVAGGRHPADRIFHLSRIEVVRRSLREETLFITAMAQASQPKPRREPGERPARIQ